MGGLSLAQFLFIGVSFFLAGIVKGVTGMGLPTVTMGLLGMVMPPVRAVTLLIVPNMVTNLWQLFTGPDFRGLLLRFWPMMVGIVAGTFSGIGLLTHGGGNGATVGLGVVLVLYSVTGLLAWHGTVAREREKWLSPLVGAVTGVIAGGTGTFIIPAVPYLQSLNLEKEALVQALGLSFTVSTIAMVAALGGRGALHPVSLWLSLFALIPALAGMAVGQRIRSRVSPATFRRWFLICLGVLGLQLVMKPWGW